MSIKNYSPTVEQASQLPRVLEYNQSSDTIESCSNIYTTGSATCSTISTTSIYTGIATSTIVNTQQVFTGSITPAAGNSCVIMNGDIQLSTPQAYVNFHSSMMKAVYATLTNEKDQEFCMPTTKAKTYLELLMSHVNEEDADKLLRILYHAMSQLKTEDPMLPSKHITSSIIEYSVKENV